MHHPFESMCGVVFTGMFLAENCHSAGRFNLGKFENICFICGKCTIRPVMYGLSVALGMITKGSRGAFKYMYCHA